jgi:hypothetical protein
MYTESFSGNLNLRPRHKWKGNIKWILKKQDEGSCEWDLIDSGEDPVVGCSEHGNEACGSLKSSKVFLKLNDH